EMAHDADLLGLVLFGLAGGGEQIGHDVLLLEQGLNVILPMMIHRHYNASLSRLLASGKHMSHIRLNTHPAQGGQAAPPVVWGARDPQIRGPVVGTVGKGSRRNAIGVHSGSYGIYRALAIAAQELKAGHRADLTDTSPAEPIGPFESWFDPKKIVSLDPWGHMVSEVFADKFLAGWDIRPTIAVTKAHVAMPEIKDAIVAGRLKPDNDLLTPAGDVRVTKAAVEPVRWLPGIGE